MFCKIYTMACLGVEGHVVQVEADMSNGLPAFRIVGEISGEVKEAGARIRTALRNSGYALPPKKWVINLAPADFKKTGTGYDFPIAIALLCCFEQINPECLEKSIFIGELGLNGNLVPVKGILSMISKASELGFEYCFVPDGNVDEASIIPGIQVFAVKNLKHAIRHLQGKWVLKPIDRKKIENSKNTDEKTRTYPLDFKDILGQEMVKHSIEISIAGHHHLLMIGPPGSGKTMMAERIPYILPEMSLEEQILITKLHSAAGRLRPGTGLLKERPFRRPHHTVSDKVLIGGGSIPIPGEMSLAHTGVLFLDEFGEFSRNTIEALRQPLESGEVFLHRVRGNYVFPASPLLIAAANPCKCGYFPDREHCRCSSYQIQNYMSKISGPIMERMDLCVRVHRINYSKFEKDYPVMDSETMYRRIQNAVDIQKERFKGTQIQYNGQMDVSMTEKYCPLDQQTSAFLEKAYEKYHLSARTRQKVLKVARTISDLENEDHIKFEHVAQSLCYRFSEDNYGGVTWD